MEIECSTGYFLTFLHPLLFVMMIRQLYELIPQRGNLCSQHCTTNKTKTEQLTDTLDKKKTLSKRTWGTLKNY